MGRLVLAVVEEYIKNQKGVTLDELQKIFPRELQFYKGYNFSKIDFIVDEYENAERINIKSKGERFFMKDAIILNNGRRIFVCNQWSKDNINKFIAKAEELGFIITEKNKLSS